MKGESIVEVHELSKVYPAPGGNITAVRGVSFSVGVGSVVAIVGPSGSGKSTLLNLMSGLERPTTGAVTIANQRLSDLDFDAATDFRRRHIGFVFQFFNLIPTMTAADNVAIPLLAEGMPRRAIAARTQAALASVDLVHRADHRTGDLSGGEMQRVAVARALVMEPLVVLADEPTGNLDSVTGDTIMRLLCAASRDAGRAMLIVTHSYQAAAYADRTLVMRDGRIVDEVATSRAELRLV